MIKFFQIFSAGVLVSDISDHFITFSTLKSKNRTSTPKTFSYRDFSKNNIYLFKNNLSNINWNSLYFLTVADDAFNSFWDLFYTVFELYFPLITKKFHKNIHKLQPFMTKVIFLVSFPFFSSPLAWNNLPNNLKNISSKKLFRINLKLSLIQTCLNYQCNRLFCYVCSNV